MSLLSYLASIGLSFAALFLILLLPITFLAARFPQIAVSHLALAIGGVHCLLLYAKPASVSALWMIPLVLIASIVVAKGKWRVGWVWPNSATIALFVFCFLIFFFRWEPPGGDPIKWGSLARLIDLHGVVPGDTRPLTPLTELRGASVGVPTWIVLFRLGVGAWERSILFLECLSLLLFAFSWRRVLRLFLDVKSADWAVAISVALFTNPQSYFSWGGTPTLLGMCFGCVLIEVAARGQQTKLSLPELLVYGLSLAFTGYSHPIGVATSSLVLSPLILWTYLGGPKRFDRSLPVVAVLFLLGLAPYLLDLGSQVSATELTAVRTWQAQMAPYLFRPENWAIYNVYAQLSAYLWNTGFLAGMLALIAWSFYGARTRGQVVAVWCSLLLACVGIENVRHWWLPASFLFYPERVGTLAVIPLSIGIGFCAIHIGADGKKHLSRTTGVLFVLMIGLQFSHRLWPELRSPGLTANDRAAMLAARDFIDEKDCVNVTSGTPGPWLAVIALRCTYPFHGLSMSTLEEERKNPTSPRFRFFTEAERAVGVGSDWNLVIDKGARLYRLP